MTRTSKQINGQELFEVNEKMAHEIANVVNPDEDELWDGRSEAIHNTIDGMSDKTRQKIQRVYGQNADIVNLETERKFRNKIGESSRKERKTFRKNASMPRKIIEWTRENIEDKVTRIPFAEREYYGGGDVNQKRARIQTQISAINNLNMMGPIGVPAPIVFLPGMPTLIPPIGPRGTAQTIDWFRMPLSTIRQLLGRTGQYEYITNQAVYRDFETLKKRWDTIENDQAESVYENITQSVCDPSRLRKVWDDNQYNIRTDLEGIIDSFYNFDDPNLQGLIIRLQADWARSNNDPLMQARLRNRRNRMFTILGNRSGAQQTGIVENLKKQNAGLESNFNKISPFFDNIGKNATNVLNEPPHINPAAPPARFGNLQDQIDGYNNELTQIDIDLRTAANKTENDRLNSRRIGIRDKLEESKKMMANQNELMKQVKEFIDVFAVHFNQTLNTNPALVNTVPPYFINPPSPQLVALEKAYSGAFTTPSRANIVTLINTINGATFLNDLKREINVDNINPNLAAGQNFWTRMREFMEGRKGEEKRQNDILTNQKRSSALEIWLAYEKATAEDRGVRDEKLRDEDSVMFVRKMQLEIEKAKDFIPYLNEELGQEIGKGFVKRLINRADFITYDEDDILEKLKKYSSTHRKLLKDINAKSSTDDILQAMEKNNVKYSELPIIWKSIFEIFKDKKIKGIDKTIEIQDNAGRPMQIFVDRLQEAYLNKYRENYANNLAKDPDILKEKNQGARVIAALKKQEAEEAEAHKVFDDNLTKMKDAVGNLYDWVFKGKTDKASFKELAKRAEEGKLTEDDKKILATMLNVKPEELPKDHKQIFNRFDSGITIPKLLYYKELFDIVSGTANYLGLSGKRSLKSGVERPGMIKKGVANTASAIGGTGAWLWETGTKPIKGGINLGVKTVKGVTYPIHSPIKTLKGAGLGLLMGAYPALHPVKTVKGIGKAAWWTTKLPFKVLGLPIKAVKAAHRATT